MVSRWLLAVALGESEYKMKIKTLISDTATLIDAYDNVALWWDDLKNRIKIVSIAYCSKRKSENRKEWEALRSELVTCEPGPKYTRLKDRLREMYDSKFRITNIQSDIARDLLDEKCNSYFFRQTRERRKKNSVHSVRNKSGALVEGTDQVLEVFREFYQSLYRKHDGSVRGGG